MADLGWRERSDLQRWIRANPDFLGSGLLYVAEEFADWEGAAGPVADRLDLLFLDEDGRLVVVELKRGLAPDRTESQALVYAAYCDQLTTADIAEQYAKTYGVSAEDARARLIEHAPVLADDQPGKVRVRIVAEDFPPSVTATVLFLRELGSGGPESAQLDIGCTKLTAYALADGKHVISAQPLIPIPETEDYLVRRRKRAADDEGSREERTRAVNATVFLAREHAIQPGTKLTVNLDWFSLKDREPLRQLLESEPEMGEMVWTGEENQARAVQVSWSDDPVSLNAHHHEMRTRAGLGGQAGATHAWIVGETGMSVRQLADHLTAEQSGAEEHDGAADDGDAAAPVPEPVGPQTS